MKTKHAFHLFLVMILSVSFVGLGFPASALAEMTDKEKEAARDRHPEDLQRDAAATL